jgi:hypothetical protein
MKYENMLHINKTIKSWLLKSQSTRSPLIDLMLNIEYPQSLNGCNESTNHESIIKICCLSHNERT